MTYRLPRLFLLLLLPAAVAASGCSIFGSADEEPAPEPVTATDGRNGGLLEDLFGSSIGSGRSGDGSIAVNSYLWQASLESLDFMPLAQADSAGGVIITDWFAPAETPEERFKVTVYILDTALRADALKVAVFRQVDGSKGWVDAPVDKGTASGLEENILTRARELRLAATGDAS